MLLNYVLPLMFLCGLCARECTCQQRPEIFDSFGTGVMGVVSHPIWMLGIKLKPLQVQLVSMCSLNW